MGIEAAITAAVASISTAASQITFGSIVIGALSSTALSFASSALLGGPSQGAGVNASISGGVIDNVKQPIIARQIVYGKARVGGGFTFLESTGKSATISNKRIHYIIPVAGHEVEKLGTVYLDDYAIPDEFISSNGEVGLGKFKGRTERYVVSITNVQQASLRIDGVTFNSGLQSNAEAVATALETTIQAASGYGDVYVVEAITTGNQDAAQLNITAVSSADALAVSNVQNALVQINRTRTNFVRIYKYTGADDQAPPARLLSEVDSLTNDFRGRRIAYIHTEFNYNQDKFPNGIPNVSVEVFGKKLYDPRDGSTNFSTNPVLAIRDYLTNTDYGYSEKINNIDDDNFSAKANMCEEFVDVKEIERNVTKFEESSNNIFFTGSVNRFLVGDKLNLTTTGSLPTGLSVSTNYYAIPTMERLTKDRRPAVKLAASYADALAGTAVSFTGAGSGDATIKKVQEPRYTVNGIFVRDDSTTRRDILLKMVGTFAGYLVKPGARWSISGGEYEAPTITLNEDNVVGPVSYSTKRPRRERFNAIRGNYVSTESYGRPTSYPSVIGSSFVTEDGGVTSYNTLDFTHTNSASMAQRVANIQLKRHRKQESISFDADLSAMRLKIGDTVTLDLSPLDINSKVFIVEDFKKKIEQNNGAPIIKIGLVLREYGSDVFTYTAADDETQQDDPTDGNIPDGTFSSGPQNVTLESGTDQLYVNQDGTVTTRLRVSWDESEDDLVGRYEVQSKRSADSAYEPSSFVANDTDFVFILDVEDGVDYDVRVRFVSPLGVASEWTESLNHTVIGKTARPSNVTGFSAQQNGNVALLRWEQITDKDVAGYEIRAIEIT